VIDPRDWEGKVYVGDCLEFMRQLPDGCVDFAFADPPYNAGVAEWDHGFAWEHDCLEALSPVVVVTPGTNSIADFLRRTKMHYQWSLACHILNGFSRGAMGFSNWIYAAVFSRGSVYRQAQDARDIILVPGGADGDYHRGQKPPKFMQWIIETFTEPGDLVFDPFLGSGTTGVVCERLGRRWLAAEINPEYAAMAEKRIQRERDKLQLPLEATT